MPARNWIRVGLKHHYSIAINPKEETRNWIRVGLKHNPGKGSIAPERARNWIRVGLKPDKGISVEGEVYGSQLDQGGIETYILL